MSKIRFLTNADMPDVIRLFQKIFQKSSKQPSPALKAYLQHLYIGLAGETAPASKVLLNEQGAICGFIGVHYFDYLHGTQLLKAAMVGSLMVDNHEQDPLGGAKLMRSLLDDNYDLILTETASETTAAMWKKLNAVQFTNYSLDWLRIISPLKFAVETAGSKLGLLKLFLPVAGFIDQRKRNAMPHNSLRWSGTPQNWTAGQTLQCQQIDMAEFTALYHQFSADFASRPQWQEQQFTARLQDALQKPDYGQPFMVKAATKTGKTVGLFLYHLRNGGTARVLELLSHPKAASQTIDALIHHAAQNGAVAIRGRTQPLMMEAMLGKRIAFTHLASTMVWAKDPAMLANFETGRAQLNGIAGEHWSCLSGHPL
ncbi:hypothetical protein [Pseudochrobactrum kiredjianiae]|uniref:GNAT family N-acetyltransferase n=1 Tax=Pseudochrobactrum kiredjianiae TaxID=386305 RepID=A0ABW3V108_9HYPH|nr:hypothetical protein [Pseudochrobactrum kiredjianiae]MDM7852878.1 hypothetical protein [Pseudochrobactrum kiredjianiae]